MLIYVKKDLFESPAQVIVNTVNTVGVMGKGIAKRYKDIYPEMFEQYRDLCEKKLLNPGQLWIYKTPHKWILNFPTKKHWRSPSRIEYIEDGLKKFVETYEKKGITSISFPLLGCGNGGLDWESEVKPLMEKYLRPLPIEVYIHLAEKDIEPEHKKIVETKKWLQSMPETLSFQEVWEDILKYIKLDDKFIYMANTWDISIVNSEKESNESYNDLESNDNINEIPTIVFTAGSQKNYATKKQLYSLWRYLRKNGFARLQDLPDGLNNIDGLVFSLLNKLDYIEIVKIASKYRSEADFSNGIRLIPYKSDKEGPVKGERLHEVKK